jgi:hypothetical protein
MSKVRQRTILKAAARHWTPFTQMGVTDEMRTNHPFLRHVHSIYSNSRFEVHLFACASSIGGVMQANVRRHGDIADITQDDMQRIKNELFSPEMTAVEIFPPAANVFKSGVKLRIMWILPEGYDLPFGLNKPTSWGRPE